MNYVIRFWAGLIGFVFALSATLITAFMGLLSSAILFVCALACTPAFYFFPNATDIIEQATQIVTSPLRFAGSTINSVWSQFWSVVTGNARLSDDDGPARVTALTTMLLAFSAACFVGVAVAPVSNHITILGYIFASLIAVLVWAAAAIRLSSNSDDVIRISACVIAAAVTAAVISSIAISSFPLKPLALILAIVVLSFLSVISLAAVWDETEGNSKSNPNYESPDPYARRAPSGRSPRRSI